jgi:PTS system ascorbate-specific IIA component
MTVGLLLITHNGIGGKLLQAATDILGLCPLETEVLSVPNNGDPDQLRQEAKRLLDQLQNEDGVLILTDLYGSTPGNIALYLCDCDDVRVVSGINLPMMIKIFNYTNLGLDEVTKMAIDGARNSILECSSKVL